jgi:hypothetical protein
LPPRDPIASTSIFPGACSKVGFLYSEWLLADLVKCVKNVEKIENCKPNFVAFLMKNPTTFAKHDHTFS